MGKAIDYILRKSSKKILMISSVIFIFFMIVVLPRVSEYTEEKSGTTLSPDTSLIYSSEDLFEMADIYGETGREAYIFLRLSFDIVWPIVYLLFLVACTAVLLNNLNLNGKFKYLILLPFIGVIFDFVENISSIIVMYRYPIEAIFFANIAPIATFIKWITLGVSFTSIIILVTIYFVGKINIRRLS